MTNPLFTRSPAPETVPDGLAMTAGRPADEREYAPTSAVVKLAGWLAVPPALVLTWEFGSWSMRLLDLGVGITMAGLLATKPAHLTFLRWTRVMIGRLLLGVGGLLLALGVFAQWMLPAIVHEVRQEVDRTVSTTVDKAKSSTVDDLRDRLPDWMK
jgi:hypothetical protein